MNKGLLFTVFFGEEGDIEGGEGVEVGEDGWGGGREQGGTHAKRVVTGKRTVLPN